MKKSEDEGFVRDIEVNDLRNRYVLTKGPTQKKVSLVSFRFVSLELESGSESEIGIEVDRWDVDANLHVD